MKIPGNSKYVKKLNRMTIVNLIKENELISRQQIAELTGLTPAAVTGIVRELMHMGFVKEVGLGESQGGRRPVNLEFNCVAGYVLGLEITSQEVTVAIADLKNVPKHIQSIEMDMREPQSAIDVLIQLIRQIITSDEYKKAKFFGIAIAFPGQLNIKEGVVKRSVNLGVKWTGLPLKEIFEDVFKLPVFIETNSKVAALGEKWFGGGQTCRNLIYINVGEGISAGIILGDSIMQGSQGYAGQIGHIVIAEEGPLCNCGNRGCLEAICGIPGLLRKAAEQTPLLAAGDPLRQRFELAGKLQINDLFESALSGESYARNILRQAGKDIGVVIASMINFYNPDAVFIGGKLAAASDVYIDDLRNTVNSHVFSEIGPSTPIVISTLGVNSGVIGACALALKKLLKSSDSYIFDDAE